MAPEQGTLQSATKRSTETKRRRETEEDSPGKKSKTAWMQDLVTRAKTSWLSLSLDRENLLDPLPWPHIPMVNPHVPSVSKPVPEDEATPQEDGEDEEEDGEDEEGDDTNSKVSMKYLDLGQNATLKAIWGKTSSVVILERPCYIELYKQVDAMFTAAGRQAFLLLGSPGVGKTAFLLYVLVKLLEKEKKVLLRTKSGALYYFKPDGQGNYRCRGVASTLEADLDVDEDIHFLADGKLPDVPEFVGKAMLACTPLWSNYKEYDKDGACRTFYLPVWSSVELSFLRKIVFPDTDLNETKERYRQWGGTPLYVLQQQNKDLAEIIRSMDAIREVVGAVTSGSADEDHPSYKVVYMRVVEGFEKYDYVFASPFVQKLVCEHQRHNAQIFLKVRGQAMTGIGGGILQVLFREKALERKTYRVREVFEDLTRQGTVYEREFNFGVPISVWTTNNSTQEYDRIIWPDSPIEESIDAFRITKNDAGESVLQVFQVTLSLKRDAHGIKFNGMSKLMKKFNIPAARTEVFIVTTSEMFEIVGWQNWRTKRNGVFKGTQKQFLKGIRQYGLDAKL